MRESRFVGSIAEALGQPASHVRQVLRALREDGQTPGIRGGDLQIEHLPAVVFGVTADRIKEAAPLARALSDLPLVSAADLPGTAGAMLERLLSVITKSPVLGDFDIDDGLIHVREDSVVLEVLSLSGRRACIRYGEDTTVIAVTTTTFPISALRELAAIIQRN